MERRDLLRLTAAAAWTAPALAARAAEAPPVGVEAIRLYKLRLFVARAAQPAKMGVVILPTIAGANEFTQTTAKAFAAEGMTAVVWDPYDGQDVPVGMMDQLAWSKKITDDYAVDSLKHIVGYMNSTLSVEKVCSIGWCLGGRFGLIHAGRDTRVAAVASYNPTVYSLNPVTLFGATFSRADFPGQTMDDFATAAAIGCPVQLARPEHDICQPAEYSKLQDALFKRKQPTLYEYYPGVGHGFAYTLDNPANVLAHRRAWALSLAMFRTA
jgi:carboxymethylenebutenolidase